MFISVNPENKKSPYFPSIKGAKTYQTPSGFDNGKAELRRKIEEREERKRFKEEFELRC